MSNFGHQRERQVVDLLKEQGWLAFRAPGSLGVADVVAFKEGQRPRLIEVKGTAAGPYCGFLPAHRQRLSEAALKGGCVPELCWWPKRRKPQFIPEEAWPNAR